MLKCATTMYDHGHEKRREFRLRPFPWTAVALIKRLLGISISLLYFFEPIIRKTDISENLRNVKMFYNKLSFLPSKIKVSFASFKIFFFLFLSMFLTVLLLFCLFFHFFSYLYCQRCFENTFVSFYVRFINYE